MLKSMFEFSNCIYLCGEYSRQTGLVVLICWFRDQLLSIVRNVPVAQDKVSMCHRTLTLLIVRRTQIYIAPNNGKDRNVKYKIR